MDGQIEARNTFIWVLTAPAMPRGRNLPRAYCLVAEGRVVWLTCGRVDGQNEARNTFIWILTASIPYQVIYPVCTLFAFERLSTLSGGPVDVWTSHIKSHTIFVHSFSVLTLSGGPVDVWTAKMKLEIQSYGY